MNWEDKTTVKLGNVGERIVDNYLRSKGIIPYMPAADGAHPFDRLCAYGKQEIFIADAKTKPARVKYPDTGINNRHYEEYKYISSKHNLDVWLFFVDSDRAQIYGNKLAVLEQQTTVQHGDKQLRYPLRQNGITYFPLQNMRIVWGLTPEDVVELKGLSSRAKEYEIAN